MQKAGLNKWAKFNGAVCKDIHCGPLTRGVAVQVTMTVREEDMSGVFRKVKSH